jgi:hypothetical protein
VRTLLQSFSTVGAFEEHVRSIAELEAREARLRAEMSFVEMAFGRPATGASQAAGGDAASGRGDARHLGLSSCRGSGRIAGGGAAGAVGL